MLPLSISVAVLVAIGTASSIVATDTASTLLQHLHSFFSALPVEPTDENFKVSRHQVQVIGLTDFREWEVKGSLWNHASRQQDGKTPLERLDDTLREEDLTIIHKHRYLHKTTDPKGFLSTSSVVSSLISQQQSISTSEPALIDLTLHKGQVSLKVIWAVEGTSDKEQNVIETMFNEMSDSVVEVGQFYREITGQEHSIYDHYLGAMARLDSEGETISEAMILAHSPETTAGCDLHILQVLPPSYFVDPFQLEGLAPEIGESVVFGETDLEKPLGVVAGWAVWSWSELILKTLKRPRIPVGRLGDMNFVQTATFVMAGTGTLVAVFALIRSVAGRSSGKGKQD
ncbi:hypothetical protein FBU30_005378 [Linnemannia zychae]|nr:hypothetical protein FBU30_005378 [Linnemannia zychae]